MKLSIIIPCYNEEKTLKENTSVVLEYLKSHGYDYEVLLVDDGSKDQTYEVMKSIEGVVALHYDENHGKGYAVNYGLKHASGDYILFMDEDLSTDLKAIDTVMEYASEYDFILGSRHQENSQIITKQPLKRRFMGKVCRVLVNMQFHFKLSDTQCGFKAMNSKMAKQLAARQIVEGFAFDVEYLYFVKLNNLKMKVIPVTWKDNPDTRVGSGSSMTFMKDLRRIKKNKKNYIIG